MTPISIDLRERIVRAVDIEGLTYRDAGERFMVSHTTVRDIVLLFEETGRLEPKKIGGNRKAKLEPHGDLITTIATNHPDMTLREIADEIFKTIGVKANTSMVCRAMRKLGLSFKKKVSSRTSGRVRTSRKGETSFVGSFRGS